MTPLSHDPISHREVLGIRAEVHHANSVCRPRGTRWGPRRLGDWEHVLVLSGELRYTTDALVQELLPGDILSIVPREQHDLEVLVAGEISCIHLDYLVESGDGAAPEPLIRRAFPVVLHDTEGGAAGAHFLRMVDACEGVAEYREGMLAALGYELAVLLTQLGVSTPQLTARTQRMMRYMRQHVAEQVTRRDLSQHFGISQSHVNAVFKRELGLTPTQYLHRIRLQLACHLLSHDALRVSEVAARLGYYDAFHFSRAFKKQFGYAPSTLLQHVSRG